MKYFYVISNLSKDYVLDVQDEVQSCLEKRGAVCRYMTDYERMKNGRHTPGEYVPEDTQCIITIGGDGTLIQAARDLAGRNIPMLGINRGHLGFLNQVDRTEDIDAAMDALVNERFRLEHRMMLRGTVFHEGKPVFQDIALNEIIATSAEHLRVLRYDLAVNDEYLNEYAADGVMVARSVMSRIDWPFATNASTPLNLSTSITMAGISTSLMKATSQTRLLATICRKSMPPMIMPVTNMAAGPIICPTS